MIYFFLKFLTLSRSLSLCSLYEKIFSGEIPWLRPDCKSQVIVEYEKKDDGRVIPHPDVVENACEAFRRSDLDPKIEPIRGGTDGSRLSFMGLPTPNIFAGEHNFHSRYEWISTSDMHKAVEVIVELCKVWAERS